MDKKILLLVGIASLLLASGIYLVFFSGSGGHSHGQREVEINQVNIEKNNITGNSVRARIRIIALGLRENESTFNITMYGDNFSKIHSESKTIVGLSNTFAKTYTYTLSTRPCVMWLYSDQLDDTVIQRSAYLVNNSYLQDPVHSTTPRTLYNWSSCS